MTLDIMLCMALILLLSAIFMVAHRSWKWKRQEQINAYYKMRLGRTLPITVDLGKHKKRRFRLFLT